MKKYVHVGTGSRGTLAYIKPLTEKYQAYGVLSGVYDSNIKRARVAAGMAAYDVKVYDDFSKMLEVEKPDTVIVASKDSTHDEYIIKALDAGCDVISEKPITTTNEKMKAIFETEKRSGKKVTVTFNCRFMNNFVKVKELIRSGAVGEILSVHYEWMLDTVHGADYFRRWHRERKNSGSLLVHKSTHHLDLLNWFLDDEPEKVNAFGTRKFYGPTREKRGARCLDCKHKDECEFYFDIESNEVYKKLYLECEDVDGYFRDGCVFSDDIDIEDSVSLSIKYKKGAVVSYSLTAHSPYEGVRLVINGNKGRIEYSSGYGKGNFAGSKDVIINVFDREGNKQTYDVTPGKGDHGGSDDVLRDALFIGMSDDNLGQMADTRAGAMSIGIGIAANKSMKEDRAVYLKEFYDYL